MWMHEHFNLRDGIDVVTFSKKMLSGGIYHKVGISYLVFHHSWNLICLEDKKFPSQAELAPKHAARIFNTWVSLNKQQTTHRWVTDQIQSNLKQDISIHILPALSYFAFFLAISYFHFHHVNKSKQPMLYLSNPSRSVSRARWFYLKRCLPPYKEIRSSKKKVINAEEAICTAECVLPCPEL